MNNPFAIDDEGDNDYNIDVEDKDIKGVTGHQRGDGGSHDGIICFSITANQSEL